MIMRTLDARVIDPTHLELAEPISFPPGERLQIVIVDKDDEGADWHQAARESFAGAYDDQDAIYDGS